MGSVRTAATIIPAFSSFYMLGLTRLGMPYEYTEIVIFAVEACFCCLVRCLDRKPSTSSCNNANEPEESSMPGRCVSQSFVRRLCKPLPCSWTAMPPSTKWTPWSRRPSLPAPSSLCSESPFHPAFPVWNLIYAPMDQHAFFRRLFENAVRVPDHTPKD